MSLADEIEKLQRLRDSGALSEDEFQRAKTRLLGGPALPAGASELPGLDTLNRLTRSTTDRWLGGVCGGLGGITGSPSWIWRLAFALLVFCFGVGLIPYVLFWIFVPTDASLAASFGKPASYHHDLA